MEVIDLDGVADFIYMAALLISIKAKMLLPLQEVDEEGEPIDPRRELVERLLDYIRFKEAAGSLSERHDRRAAFFTRGSAVRETLEMDEDLPLDVSVFDLISALRRILTDAPEESVHAVRPYEYTVEEQRDYVRRQLQETARVSFVALVRHRPKIFIIATFLAVLELTRQGEVRIGRAATDDDFFLERQDERAEDAASFINGKSAMNGHEPGESS